MAIPYSVSEILRFVNDVPDVVDRRTELDKYTSGEYRKVWADLFTSAFNPKFRFGLPLGPIPYKPSDFPGTYTRLYGEVIHRWYLYRHDSPFTETVRVRQFIQTLESIDPDDAILMLHIKDQTVNKLYPNIDINLVDRVFPELGLLF